MQDSQNDLKNLWESFRIGGALQVFLCLYVEVLIVFIHLPVQLL